MDRWTDGQTDGYRVNTVCDMYVTFHKNHDRYRVENISCFGICIHVGVQNRHACTSPITRTLIELGESINFVWLPASLYLGSNSGLSVTEVNYHIKLQGAYTKIYYM